MLLRRLLRPYLQVPLASAAMLAGLSELILHRLEVARLAAGAFPIGVSLSGALAAWVIHGLFRDSNRRAVWRRALLAPPVMATLVGVAVDLAMHALNPWLALSFAGHDLGGGAAELFQVAALSALAGLLGAFLLLGMVALRGWAEGADGWGEAEAEALERRRARRSEQLAVGAWVGALVLDSVGCAVATQPERATCLAALWPSVAMVLGLTVRASREFVDSRERESLGTPAVPVYRRSR
jgi:hypothetical protein